MCNSLSTLSVSHYPTFCLFFVIYVLKTLKKSESLIFFPKLKKMYAKKCWNPSAATCWIFCTGQGVIDLPTLPLIDDTPRSESLNITWPPIHESTLSTGQCPDSTWHFSVPVNCICQNLKLHLSKIAHCISQILTQGRNWSAHVAKDWRHTSIGISRTLIITWPPIHESTLSRLHILESGLLEMQILGQKLSKPFGANIFRGAWERAFKGGWDPLWNGKRFQENNSMLGSVCEESNYVPHYRVAGTGRGIQNNWRPLGRLPSTIPPYILEVGSI